MSQIEEFQLLKFIETADPSYVDTLYPLLLAYLGRSLVSQIACLSSVVGMQVPGMHSIFVSAALNLQKKSDNQFIKIIKTDRRFGLVDLKVQSSDIQSKLRAIVRPMPTRSLSLDDLNKKITKRFAVDQKVLVIGGTRGLGCYVVKILALMGAAVTFTYAKGAKDAELLKDELLSSNIDVNFVHFDIESPKFDELFADNPDYVFYFPTPKIFTKRSKVFEEELYNKFKLFYVDTFQTILNKCVSCSVKRVFYPSTVAVEEGTKELPEYIKAKLEGEALSQKYNNLDETSILVARLPRTLTDQTTTNLTIENKDPFEVMMPILDGFFESKL